MGRSTIAMTLLLFVIAISFTASTGTVEAQSFSGYYRFSPSANAYVWVSSAYSYGWPSYGSRVVGISVKDLPLQYAANVSVDGLPAGTIKGGGAAAYEVSTGQSHTFQLEEYVSGEAGTRYRTSSSSWVLEKSSLYAYYYCCFNYYFLVYPASERRPAAHVFTYEPEYQLQINDLHSSVPSQPEWYSKGSVVQLSATEVFKISDGERDVFKSWNLDGAEIKNPQLIVTMDRPRTVTANYEKQYYLKLESDMGTPAGEGWYTAGAVVTPQLESSIPMQGLLGVVGGKYVCKGWTGSEAFPLGSSILMDSSKSLEAVWSPDYTTPSAIIGVILGLAVVGVVVPKKGYLKRKK